ncbi:MAG: hypothetical protein WCC74_00070 [Minisyncoccia bacterium]
MADDKKKKAPGQNEQWQFIVSFLFTLALIYGFISYFFPISTTGPNVFDKVGYYFSISSYILISFVAKFMIFGIFVAIAFAILTVIWWKKYQDELAKTKEILKISATEKILEKEGYSHTLKWQQVLKYANSEAENDWVRAIISADVVLGDLLEGLSLPGDTIGEKLKAVEQGNFQTLDNAWEAHKIRNTIAHSGLDFQLNQREVRRVIGLYETVFQEFKII